MPTLFIRALSTAEPQGDDYRIGGEWLIVESNGDERSRGVTDYRGFAELVDPSANWLRDPQNIVLILPSEHVLGVNCEVPGRNVNQIRKALPFVVEEYLASDVEGMHLAHGGIRRDEPVRCNLVERELLDQWRGCFAGIGLNPGYIVSEAELLPDDPDTVYAVVDGNQVLVKTGSQAATVDRVNLQFALNGLEESQLKLINGELSAAETEALQAMFTRIDTSANSGGGSTLGYLADRWRTSDTFINLLQGDLSPPRRETGSSGRWRSVGILAACWGVLGLVSVTAQAIWAEHKANVLETEALELYRDIFPGDKQASAQNVKRRAANRLGEANPGQGKTEFLQLLGPVATHLDATAELQRVSYNQARGELGLDVMLKSYDQLDRVKAGFSAQGLAVEIISAEQQQNNQVRASIRVGVSS